MHAPPDAARAAAAAADRRIGTQRVSPPLDLLLLMRERDSPARAAAERAARAGRETETTAKKTQETPRSACGGAPGSASDPGIVEGNDDGSRLAGSRALGGRRELVRDSLDPSLFAAVYGERCGRLGADPGPWPASCGSFPPRSPPERRLRRRARGGAARVHERLRELGRVAEWSRAYETTAFFHVPARGPIQIPIGIRRRGTRRGLEGLSGSEGSEGSEERSRRRRTRTRPSSRRAATTRPGGLDPLSFASSRASLGPSPRTGSPTTSELRCTYPGTAPPRGRSGTLQHRRRRPLLAAPAAAEKKKTRPKSPNPPRSARPRVERREPHMGRGVAPPSARARLRKATAPHSAYVTPPCDANAAAAARAADRQLRRVQLLVPAAE